MNELLGVPAEKVYDERLYRALDNLLPHKEALEKHSETPARRAVWSEVRSAAVRCDQHLLRRRGQGQSAWLSEAILATNGPTANRYALAWWFRKCGMPLGYEVFEGNRTDVTTVEEIVETMERRYGKADRIWVGDRGMMSKKNIEFLKSGNRRYIIGASKASLKQFEQQLLANDWRQIREGLEVKLCQSPEGDEEVLHPLSQQRSARKGSGHAPDASKQRIENELQKIEASCQNRKWKKEVIDRRIGTRDGKEQPRGGSV